MRSTSRIIFGSGSFPVQFEDHFRSNLEIISDLGIIGGRGSFAALYRYVVDMGTKYDFKREVKRSFHLGSH